MINIYIYMIYVSFYLLYSIMYILFTCNFGTLEFAIGGISQKQNQSPSPVGRLVPGYSPRTRRSGLRSGLVHVGSIVGRVIVLQCF